MPALAVISEFASESELVDERQRARIKVGGRTCNTISFVATTNEIEQGFLSIDAHPPDSFELYEIYVLSEHRRQGVGGQLLAHAKSLAKAMRYDEVVLRVVPIDPPGKGPSKNQLRSWYESHGFSRRSNELFVCVLD